MKSFSAFFILLLFVLFFSSCLGIYKKHRLLAEVDEASAVPDEVFVCNKSLWLSYEDGGKLYYFTAKIPRKDSRKEKRNAALEIQEVENFNVQEPFEKEKVVIAKDIFPSALEEALNIMAPKTNNLGVIMPTGLKDAVLYRDANGAVKVSEPANVPKSVTVKGRLGRKRTVRRAYDTIIKYVRKKYPGDKKFLIPVESIPLVPYVYVDIENETAAAVKLPDFYEVKKEISAAGFSAGFFYSFIIKSHVFNFIKAPFTSAHRLFSTLTSSLYAGFSPYIEEIQGEIPPLDESGQTFDLNDFNRWLDLNVSKESYKGKAEILIEGQAFFLDFIEKVSQAVTSVKVRVYIFKTDPYSLSLADLLKEKSNDGVQVMVLTDELNSVLNFTKTPSRPYSKDFVMPDIKKYLKAVSNVKVRTTPDTWANFDHTKTIIIDGKTAYVGGMNFGEEYRYDWHDMMLRISGPAVIKIDSDFNHAWSYAGPGGDFAAAARGALKKNPDYQKDLTDEMYDMRFLYTKPMSAEIFASQIEAIKRAKSRIYIQNSYFSDARIIQELINARKRGVDVRVILPADNDVGMLARNNMVKANLMFRNGIKIYFYPRMSHIKAALYDNWACVGTANFDKMSLYINLEINLGISGGTFVKDFDEKLFQKDFRESELMKKEMELSSGDYIMSILSAQG
ncbi:MAG: phosphatidylserine/phosphatidylglycerophosphate/cardiolipin synthase family protein [Endomicrobium sp.]|jgi:cardiolipin synthase|nr:phosphatidylserine/phosphatidylglycerophosphate/cardiolipin synthase family protein [Endomicrobium sp.]